MWVCYILFGYNAQALYSGITYMREASALLVQPVRAMRRPQQVERAISIGSHAYFCELTTNGGDTLVRIVTMKAKHPQGFAYVIGKIAALFAIGRERWRNYTETSKRDIDVARWRGCRKSLFFTLKKQPLLFVVMLCATSVVSYAEDTMTFVASSEVCTPITVNVGSHQYTVYGTLTISQINGSVSATDCSGRKLKYEYSHSSSASYGSHDTYTFRNTYDVSRDSYSDGGSYYENTPSYDSAERVGNAVSSAVFGLGGGDE